MIDLDQQSQDMIKRIFSEILPNTNINAFGSRVTGCAKPFSDFDLVIMSDEAIPVEKLNELKFAFSNSDLSITVDIVDWHAVSDTFREIIQKDCVIFIKV